MNTNKQLIDDLVSQILEIIKPDRIILFGSFASSADNEDSDIDICVLTSETVNCRDITQMLYKHLVFFPKPIDIIVENTERFLLLSKKNELIYKEISEGITIYDRTTDTSRKVA